MGVRNREHRTYFKDVSGSSTLLATDNLSVTPRTLVAGKAKYAIFIQRILVSVITDNAATLTFQDSASTPVKIAVTKASPGVGASVLFEFGLEGRQLTADESFQLANSAAGLAADIHWEGYMHLVTTATPADL